MKDTTTDTDIESDFPEISVELRGKAAELFAQRSSLAGRSPGEFRTKVQVVARTPREIIQELADQNPLLADQIIRADGSPRSSTRFLINGKPPQSLDAELLTPEEAEKTRKAARRGPIIIIIRDDDDIVIIVLLPCDG